MATITGWSPVGEPIALRDAIDRLFESSVLQPRRANTATGNGGQVWRMPMDVYETAHEIVVRAWLPGVRPENLEITWDQGTLTIRGSVADVQPGEQQVAWHARELFHGEARATVALPGQLDVEKADASLEDGVLTLRVPKAEAARPRQIRVRAGG